MRLPALVDVTCKQVVELFGDYVEQRGMAARDRARLEQHLYACSWCMDSLHQLENVRRALGALAGVPAARTPVQHARPAGAPATPRRAFKFLTRDAKSPLSLFAWPLPREGRPGAWVDVGVRPEPCKVGIHACAPRALSSWLHDALWLIELEGPLQRCGGALVAPRARLLYEVEAWRRGGALRFAHAGHDHARDLVEAAPPSARAAARPCVASSAAHLPRHNVALAAFCAAMSIARLRGLDHFDQRGYDAERRWQSDWLRRDLALDDVLAAAGG